MSSPDELRQRYDKLIAVKDEKKREAEEQQTQVRIAEARLQEVEQEAKAQGFESIQELEKAIVAETQKIEQELNALSDILTKGEVPPSEVAVTGTIQQSDTVTSIDDLLRVGAE